MGDPDITKKPVGNDLREGKKSLPILMAINAAESGGGSGAVRDTITGAFGNPNATPDELGAAAQAIRSLGIEESVRGMATKYAKKARTSLAGYSGPVQEELAALLDFVVKRRS